MKIAVVNFSGNVGKSTTARHLLAPRIPDATVIPVETINSDGTNDEALKGKEFGKLMRLLAMENTAVVDVGASNVEDFIHQMKLYHGSHEDFDYYVVPCVPNSKQQRDTISTINALNEIGIDPTRIRVVFNQVEPGDNARNLFELIIEFHRDHKNFMINQDAVIHTNELFGLLKETDQSIKFILEDKTDYRTLIKETNDLEERIQLSKKLSLKRLAAGVSDELDHVFDALLA